MEKPSDFLQVIEVYIDVFPTQILQGSKYAPAV